MRRSAPRSFCRHTSCLLQLTPLLRPHQFPLAVRIVLYTPEHVSKRICLYGGYHAEDRKALSAAAASQFAALEAIESERPERDGDLDVEAVLSRHEQHWHQAFEEHHVFDEVANAWYLPLGWAQQVQAAGAGSRYKEVPLPRAGKTGFVTALRETLWDKKRGDLSSAAPLLATSGAIIGWLARQLAKARPNVLLANYRAAGVREWGGSYACPPWHLQTGKRATDDDAFLHALVGVQLGLRRTGRARDGTPSNATARHRDTADKVVRCDEKMIEKMPSASNTKTPGASIAYLPTRMCASAEGDE